MFAPCLSRSSTRGPQAVLQMLDLYCKGTAPLRRIPKSWKIVKILILDHSGGVPDRLSENCQKIEIRPFSRVPGKYSKSTPREAQILQHIVKKYSRTIFRQYFDKNMVAAFGRSQKRGGGLRPPPLFWVHILSKYCMKIVLEYFLTIF